MRVRRRRNITIGILCCMLVFMGIGYAALQQVLTINGTGSINGSWKIYIKSIAVNTTSVTDSENLTEMNEGTYVDTADDTIGYFLSSLKAPGDYVTYDLVIRNDGSIKGVLESVELTNTPDSDFQNYLNSVGKDYSYFYTIEETIEEGVTLDAGAEVTYQITVRYNKDAEMIPVGNLQTEIKINYVQEGANIPGSGGSGGGTVDPNTSPIIVDSNGLVTGYDKEALTDENGYVVIPATTADGEEVVSIDSGSFAEYNVALVYAYDEETGEEVEAGVIYDEENYDELYAFADAMLNGESDSSGSGTTSSSSSAILGKDINPTNLIGKTRKNKLIEKLSGSTSGSGSGSSSETIVIYKASSEEFKALIEGKTVEYAYFYMVPSEGTVEEATSKIEKLDLTNAIYLKTIEASTFVGTPLSEIKLGNTIETIGDSAFEDVTLSSLILPSSLKTIGESAFRYSSITGTLTIPEGVTTIGERAFYSNQFEGTLVIPDSVTNLGYSAFQSNKLSRVEIGNGLTTIQSNTFANNQLTEGIKLSNSITSIESCAFQSAQVSKLEFEESSKLETIGYSSFYGNQINEVIIPASVTTINTYAFSNNGMTSLSIEDTEEDPSKLTKIFNMAFSGNQITGELIIPASVIEIGSYMYEQGAFTNNKITKLTFKEGSKLTTLGGFYGNSITSLEIPNSVTTINTYAFYGNQISELTVPSSVTTIESYAFDGENNLLTTLNIDMEIIQGQFNTGSIENLNLGPNVKTIMSNSFSNNKISELIIPSTVTTIESGAFTNNGMTSLIIEEGSKLTKLSGFSTNNLTNIVIPSGVTTIGSSAFYANSIKELIIPTSVTTIEASAFSGNGISEIIIPENLTTIGDSAFSNNSFEYGKDIVILYNENNVITRFDSRWETIGFPRDYSGSVLTGTAGVVGIKFGCYMVSIDDPSRIIDYKSNDVCSTDVEIPSTINGTPVTTIGKYAFDDENLTNVIIPSTITKIEQDAFDSASITTLSINMETVSGYVFYLNSSIQNLIIGSNVKTIDHYAFHSVQISSLIFEDTEENPSALTSIGDYAFSNNQISKLTIPSSLTYIGSGAIYFNQISELIIPANVQTIQFDAFRGNQISSLIFENTEEKPSQLTAIAPETFANNQISELTIPSSVTAIGSYAFERNQISELIFEDTEERPSSLTTIGSYAFSNNNLTGNLIIPASVTTIGDKFDSYPVFSGNSNLTKIIIKRADTTGMTLGTNWNLKDDSVEPYTYYEVVYDPNYVG